jgi:hypothetical protein
MRSAYYFFMGIIAAFSALFIELAFLTIWSSPEETTFYLFNQLDKNILAAILIEEVIKFIFVRQATVKFSRKKSTLIAALLIGLGFSAVEIFFNIRQENILDYYLYLNLAGILVLHTLTAGFIGYFIFRQSQASLPGLLSIITLASIIHFFYNFLIIYNLDFWAPIYLFMIAVIFAFLSFSAKPEKNTPPHPLPLPKTHS